MKKFNESKAIVTQLITNAKMIRTQITQDRQDISQTSEHLRQTWISFIEAFYFSTQTRNIFPPPQAVTQHINQRLNQLAELAFPNPQERTAWVARMNTEIRQTLPSSNPPQNRQ